MEKEPIDEVAETQVRKFLTVLFVTRRMKLLKILAGIYCWTPEQLADYQERFVKPADCVPIWSTGIPI